jgi:hypothetical protein
MNNTHFAQWIPPTEFHCVTGTWTNAAGAVAGTIAKHVAATDEASVINIPVVVPSNSIALQGAKLDSIEIDFEILDAACDALAAVVNKVTRGADGAVAVVASLPFSYDTGHDTAEERVDVDQHRMTLTLTTPVWLDNDEYVLVEITADKAGTTTMDFLAAVANYTLRG